MRKLLLLAAMLAMVLVVASPALAQQNQQQFAEDVGGDVTQCQNQAANVNLQYQSAGDVTQTINQNCFANAGGEVEQIAFKKDGGTFKTVGTTFVKDAKAPVWVDKTGTFFTWVKDEVVVLEKDVVTFFPTVVKKDVAAVQYQYAGPAQYQYAKGVAPLKIAVLPDTGGASLITLGAGALLVAGGLLAARRIVR